MTLFFQFALPMHSRIPGSELTKEPFRWDQRLFSLVLRLSGTPAVERDTGLVASDSSPIDAMCEVTGGNKVIFIFLASEMLHRRPKFKIELYNSQKTHNQIVELFQYCFNYYDDKY